MKKLIYISGGEYRYIPGVYKKIHNEIKALSMNGFDTKLIFVEENPKWKKAIPFSSSFRWKDVQVEPADCLYVRWEAVSFPFLRMLKRWKRENPELTIVLEFGTYPYEDELKKLSNIVTSGRDAFYRRFLKRYVDIVTLCTSFSEVFGIPAIEMVNCITVDDVKVPERTEYRPDNTINILSVASIEYYYGYDRLIRGIANYYQSDRASRDVQLHLVGDGTIVPELKELCKKVHVEDHVTFYGYRTGKDLDDIYEMADIGIDVLGGHRKGDIWFGTLKSREYMCKGLPFVTEYPLPENIAPIYPYILKVPDDESDIDLQKLVDFFDEIKKESRQETISKMRGFAYTYCDISVAMNPIIDFLESE